MLNLYPAKWEFLMDDAKEAALDIFYDIDNDYPPSGDSWDPSSDPDYSCTFFERQIKLALDELSDECGDEDEYHARRAAYHAA